MSLLENLRMSKFSRKSLDGKKVHYRVRWAPEEVRQGTIARMKDMTLFIGCNCLHHNDLISLAEVMNGTE